MARTVEESLDDLEDSQEQAERSETVSAEEAGSGSAWIVEDEGHRDGV